MIHADLHSHSILSDGTLTPEALVDAADAAGIRAFALTDHDSAEGLPRAQAQCALRGSGWVPGAEVSWADAEKDGHLLGLLLTD